MKIILTLLSLFLNNSFAQGDCNITQVQPSPFCQGSSFDINNEQDILDYQTNFGDDGSGPRNVRIRSNLNVYDLNLKSPCEVSLDQKIKINATNNICIIGSKIKIKKQMDFTAQDVGIHSSENDFLIGEKAKISATNLSISSNGSLKIKKQAKFDVNQNMEIIGSGIGAGNGIIIGEKFKGSGVSLLINASSSLNIKKQFDANFSNLVDLKGIVQGSNSN
ncbi:MAG: hypothetical protein NXH75_17375, partial [Halobacteriovoraceae bacterium]|nr:hypothetical protein [Halobacteriovoraceae bacterium]